MERTKLLTIAIVGLLLLNLATISFLLVRPGNPGGNRRPRGEGPSTIIIERLQFDTQQQQRYQQLIKAHQQQTRQLTHQSVALHREYYELLEKDTPDTARATALSRQIARNQQVQVELNFTHFRAIKALCRPNQQPAFKALASELSQLFGRQQHPSGPDSSNPPEYPPR